MDDPYAELAKVKARIAEMERMASAPRGMETALGDHYSPTQAPVDRKTRDLQNRAKFYSPTEEDSFRQREKDPERYDRDLAAMGGDLLGAAPAREGRSAFVKLGGKTPALRRTEP